MLARKVARGSGLGVLFPLVGGTTWTSEEVMDQGETELTVFPVV